MPDNRDNELVRRCSLSSSYVWLPLISLKSPLRAILLVLSLIPCSNAYGDDILCATMIVILGGQAVPKATTEAFTWDIRTEWLRITHRLITEEEFAKLSLACVNEPSATVQDKIKLIAGSSP